MKKVSWDLYYKTIKAVDPVPNTPQDILKKIVKFHKTQPKKLVEWFNRPSPSMYAPFLKKLFKETLTPDDFEGMSEAAFLEFRKGLFSEMKRDQNFANWLNKEMDFYV